jgi:hypothetical protein
MFYELWDIHDGNIINTYDTEGEALVAVRILLDLNGPEYAHALSLTCEQDDSETALVAKGTALAERARAASAA